MKSAKQTSQDYTAKIELITTEEGLRKVAYEILHTLVTVLEIGEAKAEQAEAKEIPYKECSGKGTTTPWLITEDLIDSGEAVGTCGGSSISQAQFDLLREGRHENIDLFCLYDDDGELYYAGRMLESPETQGFEPLDDFGMPNAGCTLIKIQNKETKVWEDL